MSCFTHSSIIGSLHSSGHMYHIASSQLRPHCPCGAASSQLTAQSRVYRPPSGAHTGWWANHSWVPCGAVNIHEKQQMWFPLSRVEGQWRVAPPSTMKGKYTAPDTPSAVWVTAPVRVQATLLTGLAVNCLAPPVSLKLLKALLLKYLNFGK